MTVYEEATAISGDIAELRHAIHREPEIGVQLPKTQAKILAALDGLRSRSPWASSSAR